jgi:hypothetical protein
MSISTFSSRQFNQEPSRAKKASLEGPVFITDRGKPAHVLMSFQEYQRLAKTQAGFFELLGMPPGIEDVEFNPPRIRDVPQPAEFD